MIEKKFKPIVTNPSGADGAVIPNVKPRRLDGNKAV